MAEINERKLRGQEKRASIEMRVDEVLELLLEKPNLIRVRRSDLWRKVGERYGVSDRQAKKYVSWAFEKLAEITEKGLADKLKLSILDRESIIRRARRSGDLRSELAALKDRDALLGLYVERHEVTGKDGGEIQAAVTVSIERKIVHGQPGNLTGDLPRESE